MEAASHSGEFQTLTSIEIFAPYIHAYRTRHGDAPGVRLLCGDSAALLPSAAPDAPCFFFLDAHWWDDPHGIIPCPKEPLPLWEELRYIVSRPHADLVVVDDVQVFGGHAVVTEEWLTVTLDSINTFLGNRRQCSLLHENRYILALKARTEL